MGVVRFILTEGLQYCLSTPSLELFLCFWKVVNSRVADNYHCFNRDVLERHATQFPFLA